MVGASFFTPYAYQSAATQHCHKPTAQDVILQEFPVGSAGCGPSCAAMVIATLKDKSVTPETTCAWSSPAWKGRLEEAGISSFSGASFKRNANRQTVFRKRRNASLPLSVRLKTPACSSTCAKTAPVSFRMISRAFSGVKV